MLILVSRSLLPTLSSEKLLKPHLVQSVVYASDNLPHDEANSKLGGTTALLKAHCSITLELVAREAVQVLGGIGHTRGGVGERIERIRRDVKGIAIPGVSCCSLLSSDPLATTEIYRRLSSFLPWNREARRSCSTTGSVSCCLLSLSSLRRLISHLAHAAEQEIRLALGLGAKL